MPRAEQGHWTDDDDRRRKNEREIQLKLDQESLKEQEQTIEKTDPKPDTTER